ncbi:hypothetical protein DQ04_00981140 [Trypanosoma grayi]|uniref:hypothetical protein n=1 Tax=Trypanosoma grayi TaxID=71804 RepID=UPI0004F4ACE6|nr:hypothetical protein DQ04_00981140 [Trypanosoma grayi]KEG13484.1 hypothetical protein DQ04_00981140 [Trypanosoma grayi]
MLRRLALGPGVVLQLRFDRCREPLARDSVRYKQLPESMQPKSLGDNFTPFPLPKFDDDLGYGPVRLRNIPDIERAKERQQQRGAALMEASLEDMGDLQRQQNAEEEEEAAEGWTRSSSAAMLHATQTREAAAPVKEEEDALGGYSVSRDYPLIDCLQCDRTLESLLSQFAERPQVEARSAALADMASTIPRRSDEELVRMLDQISIPFTPNGRGLNFLVTKVCKFGRPYFVTNSLVSAYVNLMNAATVALVQEQPWRLPRSPALTVQLLHFMALIKVFEPNKWFTYSDHAPSNRADYSHPRGVNRTTAFWGTGEELFDFMVELVRCDEGGANAPLLDLCSDAQLVDLLNGFAAVMPDGRAIGDVFNSIMTVFLQRVRRRQEQSNGVPWAPQDIATVERMYLSSVLSDAGNAELLRLLLHDTSCPRGADFFAAVSRTRDAMVHARALVLLQEAIDVATERGDTATLLPLLESGSELLLSLADKDAAYAFAVRNQFDHQTLRSFQHCAVVADRLLAEQPCTAPRIPSSLKDLQAQLRARNDAKSISAAASSASVPEYLSRPSMRRSSRPVMTLLSQLEYLNGIDSVYLLHSSLMATGTDQLVSAVRRLPSGKDSLIVTTCCLRELSVKSTTSARAKERAACAQALEIIAYELEKGRAVLLPLSEEIRLHDAGVYCDEDLMLWTVAAFFARELPLVRVLTLLHGNNAARSPHRFLKGAHNLLSSSRSLYDRDAPLLAALHSKELKLVTRHAKLRKAVRDRGCTLYYYNPVRARFVYRRDTALFDRYHVTARHLAPGFSRGALQHDWRGLGVYTPDHPQVPYRPLEQQQQQQHEAV